MRGRFITIIGLSTLVLTWIKPAGAQDQKHIHQQGVLELASSPGLQISLAESFRNLALQEQVLADLYERLAALYNDKASHVDLNLDSAEELESEYRVLAQTELKAAVAARTIAADHSHLAELIRDSLAAHRGPSFGDAAFRK